MSSPEAEAREVIDHQLTAAGWVVQDRDKINLSASPRVAIREMRSQGGPADYILLVDCKTLGVVEAKRAEQLGMTAPWGPKTLIFTKEGNHAEDIVTLVREQFGKKITYKASGKSEDIIQALSRRNALPSGPQSMAISNSSKEQDSGFGS